MPLQSREVVTCRLIFDCDAEWDDCDFSEHLQVQDRSSILCIPAEARLQIWRYLLRLDHNREPHFRRIPYGGIDHLLKLDSRRILEAPQFKHKSKQEINGILPLTHTCQLHPAILRTCSTLYWEARTVLYVENKVVAIQCGITGLGSRLRNYGIPTFGPLQFSRLGNLKLESDENDEDIPGERKMEQATFDPVILFKGHKSKSTSPYYICSHKDSHDLLHALWIMIKCPFARSMRFTVHLTSNPKYKSLSSTDRFVRTDLMPWMHNHVDMLTMENSSDARLFVLQERLAAHHKSSGAEANVYTYNTVCSYLESLKDMAEKAVDEGKFVKAETWYERVCYEACSVVRTRTGKLVDVSTKTHDGINRVCKLIAISAFRLCELRSGAIKVFRKYRKSQTITPCASPKTEATEEQVLEASKLQKPAPSIPATMKPAKTKVESKSAKYGPRGALTPIWANQPTTRLPEPMAIEHAIMAGLLALRLPCATPVTEWNVRLNLMLLYLFILQNDLDNALSCIRRLHLNCNILLGEANAKNKTGQKWEDLDALVKALQGQIDTRKSNKERKKEYQAVVEQCQDVVRKMWNERLVPKKGYTGLIWTFRWA